MGNLNKKISPNHLVLKFAVRTMSDDADSMNFDWLDTGQLPALPVLFDDEHVELLPVTEEGDDRETGSPSLVTTAPSASPALALSTPEVLPSSTHCDR